MVTTVRRKPNLLRGVIAGGLVALLTSVTAAAIYAVRGAEVFDRLGVSLGSAIALYWSAGLIGGAIVGLMLPITTWRWGAAIVGAIAASPLYVGVAVLFQQSDLVSGVLAAIMVGGIVGYGLWSPVSE